MFDDLFLADYSGTEVVGAVILIVLAALCIAAWLGMRGPLFIRLMSALRGIGVEGLAPEELAAGVS